MRTGDSPRLSHLDELRYELVTLERAKRVAREIGNPRDVLLKHARERLEDAERAALQWWLPPPPPEPLFTLVEFEELVRDRIVTPMATHAYTWRDR